MPKLPGTEPGWRLLLAAVLAISGVAAPGAADTPAIAPAAGVTTGPAVLGTYRVPYRLSETRHLLVRAKLNGKGPFRFVVDTGAPAVYVSREAAERAGVRAGEDGWGTIDRLEIEGGAVLQRAGARVEEPFQIKGMNALGLAGTRMDGVLGYTLLARFRIQIDLTRPVMTWALLDYDPPAPVPAAEVESEPSSPPPPGVAGLENLAKVLTALLPRRGEDEVVGRGHLGIELEDRSASPYGRLSGRTGPTVRAVLAGSPASRAGLRPGDRITHLTLPGRQPQAVRSTADVLRLSAGTAPGETLGLTVLRARKRVRLRVTAERGL